jgi:hypothetical protein
VPLLPLVTFLSLVVLAVGLLNVHAGKSVVDAPVTEVVTVDGATPGHAIPAGFLGLSLEYSAVESYAGADPTAINPVFEQLIRNLVPGQQPVLRIGGDSADWTWWPMPGVARPPGVTYSLDDNWLRVTQAVTRALDARLILGLNLEAGSPELAATEASALSDGIGSGSVLALELGNEPELYGSFAWYRTPDGHKVTGRPRGYDFSDFTDDFTTFSDALSGFALAGPSTGGPGWAPYLSQFLAAEPRVKLVTVHRYPLQLCFTSPSSEMYPTIDRLLAPQSSAGLGGSFASSIAVAHARGLAVRVDEINSVSCGAYPAVSRTFASALWALDVLFELANVGVDGVNVHTYPGAGYELFRFNHTNGRWQGSVAPEYYGLLMFAKAAPPGSRLLTVGGDDGSAISAWATKALDGTIRVVLINKDLAKTQVIKVRMPVSAGTAKLERLQAPSAVATSGETLAGQSIAAQSVTGALQGPTRTDSVEPDGSSYTVSLPAASAALLTLGEG